MPLTRIGEAILADLIKKHGEKKGKRVFYSTMNTEKPGTDKWHKGKKK